MMIGMLEMVWLVVHISQLHGNSQIHHLSTRIRIWNAEPVGGMMNAVVMLVARVI
jgi:hypothetical protein